ncbi:MAG TPA: hypothetical protein VEF03_09815 [Candidatus Binataceae bacterium]|nr:hypothetical protein [Candidatus Binataceae bacterium]
MAQLDAIVLPGIDPWQLLGLQSHLLEAVSTRASQPALLIYASHGRMLSIGRYQFYGGPSERNGIGVVRRLTGGRVVGAGEGWLGLALILPSRTALLGPRDAALKPDQVMNRYARGLIAAMRAIGIDAFYPGRDAITVGGREIAMCSFETDAAGGMLFEAIIAVNRGMEEVVHDLERFDPEGAVTSAIYGPENATKIVRECDRDVAFEEIADAIVRGYNELLGGAEMRQLSGVEIAIADRRGATMRDSGWMTRKALAGEALVGRIAGQLGAAEMRISIRDGRIENLSIGGEFIANSPGIAALGDELRGRPLDMISVGQAVTSVFAGGENFILGIGDLSNLVKLIAGAR